MSTFENLPPRLPIIRQTGKAPSDQPLNVHDVSVVDQASSHTPICETSATRTAEFDSEIPKTYPTQPRPVTGSIPHLCLCLGGLRFVNPAEVWMDDLVKTRKNWNPICDFGHRLIREHNKYAPQYGAVITLDTVQNNLSLAVAT